MGEKISSAQFLSSAWNERTSSWLCNFRSVDAMRSFARPMMLPWQGRWQRCEFFVSKLFINVFATSLGKTFRIQDVGVWFEVRGLWLKHCSFWVLEIRLGLRAEDKNLEHYYLCKTEGKDQKLMSCCGGQRGCWSDLKGWAEWCKLRVRPTSPEAPLFSMSRVLCSAKCCSELTTSAVSLSLWRDPRWSIVLSIFWNETIVLFMRVSQFLRPMS